MEVEQCIEKSSIERVLRGVFALCRVALLQSQQALYIGTLIILALLKS